jgi:hypothetical protein
MRAYPPISRIFYTSVSKTRLPFIAQIRQVGSKMADAVQSENASPVEPKAHQEPALPKLSTAEFKAYNRMAEHMDYFHNHFRATWKMLYAACSSGRRPANMSLRQFISSAEQFCHQLTMHHTIEEQHIFPVPPSIPGII